MGRGSKAVFTMCKKHHLWCMNASLVTKMVIIKSRKARTFLRMEIMVEDNDIIWPGSVAMIMSRQDNAREDNVRAQEN